MTIHFIGAGPGSADLLTLRAKKIISETDICMYAGSLVSKEILTFCKSSAKIINTSYMHLDEIINEYLEADKENLNVARLHSGDLSIWSALGEQIRKLKEKNIKYTITPGITSFSAASAVLENEFTLPHVSQTVILTRTEGSATPMPNNEKLEEMAKIGATLVIHLSILKLKEIINILLPFYGSDCPIAILYRVSWPEEKIFRGTLNNIIDQVSPDIKRSALIVVGRALFNESFKNSSLYSKNYETQFRKLKKN